MSSLSFLCRRPARSVLFCLFLSAFLTSAPAILGEPSSGVTTHAKTVSSPVGPERYLGFPRGTVQYGQEPIDLELETGTDATCRFAVEPGIDWSNMSGLFEQTGSRVHRTPWGVVEQGITSRRYVRCRDAAGTNLDDYEVSFYPEGWHPTRLRSDDPGAGLRFFVESGYGLVPVLCGDACRAAEVPAGGMPAQQRLLDKSYCDVDAFPDGCVRRWLDRSGYTSTTSIEGRDFGQDDLDKPGLVLDCVGGLPCVRGGMGEAQERSFEIELGQEVGPLDGAVSVVMLVQPRERTDSDSNWFGFAGTQLLQSPGDDRLRLRIGFGYSIPVSVAGAVAWDRWQIVEIHRDANNRIRVVVDGVDRTLLNASGAAPTLSGPFYWRFLFSVSRGFAFHGDFAAVALYEGELDEKDAKRLRQYLEETYSL